MHKLTSAQLTALAGVARTLDRLQAAIDDPSRSWARGTGNLDYSVAGAFFQVDSDTALAEMVKRRELLLQHLHLHGIDWEPGKQDIPADRWAGETGTHWRSGTKPASWYDQAQGG